MIIINTKIMKHYKLYINGQFVDSVSKKTFDSIDPSTEESWASIAEAQQEDVNNAVESAYEAFHGEWSKISPTERGKFIRKIGDQLKKNAELLGENFVTLDSAYRFKGLENNIVILTGIDENIDKNEIMYVAISRAKVMLIVLSISLLNLHLDPLQYYNHSLLLE